MGEYIDLFVKEIGPLKEHLKEDELYNEISERIKSYWINIPDVEKNTYDIIGVDSSSQSIDLSNGYSLLVVRACAVSNEKKRALNVYLTTGELAELKSRLMENIEHELLKDNLHGVNLIDGSLYGRANHIPREFKNDGFEKFSFIYYNNYRELIEKIEREKNIVIGISKSSSTTFLRDIVVKEMYEEELANLDLGKDRKIAKSLPYLALDRKTQAKKMAKSILEDRGYHRAYKLVMELTRKRPDMWMISGFGIGMSKPVLLGASARVRRMYQEISKSKDILQRMFPSIEIKEEHIETVLDYLNLPAFVSFYISFSPGLIFRVDFPAYLIGLHHRMQDIDWPEVLNVNLKNIISTLRSDYGDNYCHSIHLYAADMDARLPYGDFIEKYAPIIMKKLNVNPTMGDLRYWFRR